MKTPSFDRDQVRGRLLEMRHGLLHRRGEQLGRIEEELETREPAWEDAASESSDATLGDRLAAADLRAAREIQAAIDRLDAGTYGVCTECEARIDRHRLDVLPAASMCADCAFANEGRPPAHTDRGEP